MDILFLNTPITFSKKIHYPLDYPQMGILCLMSLLQKKGYQVSHVENRDGKFTIEQMLGKIEELKPKIIGFSAFTSNMRGTVQLARAIKEKFGDAISIALGGPHVSADPEVINRFPFFDWAITQEAEITLPEIMTRIIHQNEKVKGVFSGQTPFSLDDYPFPAWDLIDWSRYEVRTNNIMASRGCPFRCVFCSIPAIDRKTRYRSPKKVVDEIKASQQYGKTNCYTFLDDTLTLNRQFIWDICREIIDRGLAITFEGHTRANLIDEELLLKMKRAGLTGIIFGVESGNERIRNEVIGKGIKDEDVFKAIDLCHRHNIRADEYLMLGFPGETEREIEDTVNFPWRSNPDIFGLHLTLPLPGARIWQIAIREGVIPSDTIDKYINGEFGEGFNENWPKYVPQGLTLKYLEDARARAYRKYYLRPSFIWKRFLQDIKNFQTLRADVSAALAIIKKGNVEDV